MEALAEYDWQIKTTDSPFVLPSAITDRYLRLPQEIGEILAGLDACVSPDQKSWLLCLPDYHGNSESAFVWNEFEKQALQAAQGDVVWQDEIVNFWNDHFPIYISVSNGYEYAAISLVEDSYGRVVCGREPEYEETTSLADNFSQFVTSLAR